MKLKSIYIDGLHNAVAKTYQLGDLVYLFGRNGAGKTTVLQAIQLALLGYIPGSHKTREALLKHSRDGKILVRLDLNDNGKTISIERKYAPKSSDVTIIPSDFDIQSVISEIELPIFNFDEFINQTANKLKEYFIKNILPTSGGNINWEEILREGLFDVNVENQDEVIAYGMDLVSRVSGEPIEQVTQANSIFREEQSFNRQELQRLQSTIDSLIYYSDYNGPRDIDEINTNLLSLGALRDALIRYESAKQIIDQNQADLQILQNTYDGMGGAEACDKAGKSIQQYKTQYVETSEELKIQEQKMAELKAQKASLDTIVINDALCPYTKTKCSAIDVDSIRAEILGLTADMTGLSTTISDLKAKIAFIDNAVRTETAQLNKLQDLHNQINALQNSLTGLPEKPATDKTLAELDFMIEQYNEDKTKLQANKVYEDTIENITKMKYKSELNNDALTAWIKLTDTNGLQTKLTVKPFEELATKMTGYIQSMYGDASLKAKFNISTKANSFSFGIIRNDKYIPYEQLSSGEKCLYTLALMICITNNGKSPLKLILIDNSLDNLDDTAVEHTFTALKGITDIQFIMAGVKACKNAEDVMIRI